MLVIQKCEWWFSWDSSKIIRLNILNLYLFIFSCNVILTKNLHIKLLRINCIKIVNYKCKIKNIKKNQNNWTQNSKKIKENLNFSKKKINHYRKKFKQKNNKAMKMKKNFKD